MSLLVQKFGGSSLGNLDRIQEIADKIISSKNLGHDIVVVVSAMYGETDRLISLANAISDYHEPREFDVLISSGEQVSMALLSLALNAKNCPAKSYTGAQIGILTDNVHTKAKILKVDTKLLESELAKGYVIIVAGFQGINQNGDITTLGRGGSDTTAVAIASALNAQECQIYTDVDGVYTTDPHLLPEAKLIPEISFAEMLEMSSLGAKVLQMRSVEFAHLHHMPIRVLSTFGQGKGTLVTYEDNVFTKNVVRSITYSPNEVLISFRGIPISSGFEEQLLMALHALHIEMDMINATHDANNKFFDFSFTLQSRDYVKAKNKLHEINVYHTKEKLLINSPVAKLSLIGIGLRSNTQVLSTIFQTLSKANIPVQCISSSEIKISLSINENFLTTAVRYLHQAFHLDQEEINLQTSTKKMQNLFAE